MISLLRTMRQKITFYFPENVKYRKLVVLISATIVFGKLNFSNWDSTLSDDVAIDVLFTNSTCLHFHCFYFILTTLQSLNNSVRGSVIFRTFSTGILHQPQSFSSKNKMWELDMKMKMCKHINAESVMDDHITNLPID